MSPCRPQHRGAPCWSSAPHLATRPLLQALLLPQPSSRSSVLLSVSSFGPSSLVRLLWLLLTSDSASEDLPISVAQWHAVRSPRVLRTHLHAYACRIYAASSRASTGLRRSLPSRPDASPHPLPVRQASALLTASSRSHLTMGTVAARLTLPLAGCVEDFHLQVGAPCRAHKKKGASPRGMRP